MLNTRHKKVTVSLIIGNFFYSLYYYYESIRNINQYNSFILFLLLLPSLLSGAQLVNFERGRSYIHNSPSAKCVAPLFRDMSLAKVLYAGGGACPLRPCCCSFRYLMEAKGWVSCGGRNIKAFLDRITFRFLHPFS